MATFVLIHGGGHGGWCYQPVARILQRAGHSVYAPSLAGMGEHRHLVSPAIDLEAQIAGVVNLIELEDLSEVILAGHSYGGVVITGVADRLADRIAHRVYLDALYPENGQSADDVACGRLGETRADGKVVDGVELVLWPNRVVHFGLDDPELVEWVRPRLTPHPWRCFEQKLVLRNESAMRAIPESHLICSGPFPGRDVELLRQRSQGRVWEIDTGHDLMLTQPEWLADKLMDLAA